MKGERTMKSTRHTVAAVLTVLLLGLNATATAQQTVDTRIGKLEFTHDFANGYPTDETVEKLFNEMDFQRAVQAYIWSIPLISFEYWQGKQNKELGLKNGQLAYLVTYDEKVCCLTLNVTTPYVQTFIDLREDGPMVIEIPQGGEVRGAVADRDHADDAPWEVPVRRALSGSAARGGKRGLHHKPQPDERHVRRHQAHSGR
jgi:hypothetical protein